MTDLIRKSDADAAIVKCKGNGATRQYCRDAIAALPAVTVGVRNLAWGRSRSGDYSIQETHGQGPKPYMVTRGSKIIGWCHTEGEGEAIADKDNTARILAALEPAAPDPAAIREAWEKAYWRMRSYAVHDDDCKLNKPPRFDGPCSCGLTAALEEALALIQKGAAE